MDDYIFIFKKFHPKLESIFEFKNPILGRKKKYYANVIANVAIVVLLRYSHLKQILFFHTSNYKYDLEKISYCTLSK